MCMVCVYKFTCVYGVGDWGLSLRSNCPPSCNLRTSDHRPPLTHTTPNHPPINQQPEDAARVKRYRFEKDRRLSLGSQLLQRAVIAWTFGVPYRDILIARTGAFSLFVWQFCFFFFCGWAVG